MRFVSSSAAQPWRDGDVCGESAGKDDPLLSESGTPVSFGSKDEQYAVHVPTVTWVDHMEFVDGLARAGAMRER